MVARLSLCMLLLETLLHDWERQYQALDRDDDSPGVWHLFDEDLLHADFIKSLDLSLIRSTSQETLGRLDSHVLAIATASSAAAALAGAAIGRFG